MDVNVRGCNGPNSATQSELEDQMDLRRGPWTVEEDRALINYIANHGEGRWNTLARCAGLRRTGKSCRLRWLNYLRPDVRRGNITLEEQLLILELHSRWGNRWSKIAQHLPGRTDNEIKNYWRTRVQKHAKQLQCDVNSKQFKDTMRYLWMPRLLERIRASSSSASAPHQANNNYGSKTAPSFTTDNSSTATSSDSIGAQVLSPVSDYYTSFQAENNMMIQNAQTAHINYPESLTTPSGYFNSQGLMEFQGVDHLQHNNSSSSNSMWFGGEDTSENLWNVEDIWFLQQQLPNGF